jgi:hypothetical protein
MGSLSGGKLTGSWGDQSFPFSADIIFIDAIPPPQMYGVDRDKFTINVSTSRCQILLSRLKTTDASTVYSNNYHLNVLTEHPDILQSPEHTGSRVTETKRNLWQLLRVNIPWPLHWDTEG